MNFIEYPSYISTLVPFPAGATAVGAAYIRGANNTLSFMTTGAVLFSGGAVVL